MRYTDGATRYAPAAVQSAGGSPAPPFTAVISMASTAPSGVFWRATPRSRKCFRIWPREGGKGSLVLAGDVRAPGRLPRGRSPSRGDAHARLSVPDVRATGRRDHREDHAEPPRGQERAKSRPPGRARR